MARISRFRNVAFLFVLLGALVSTQTTALAQDPCAGLGHCTWCSSGQYCYVVGGASACDAWDGTEAPCDWDIQCFSGGKWRCECTLCS